MSTRELFISEITADGLREVWNPTDEELLELGFVRVERLQIDGSPDDQVEESTDAAPVRMVGAERGSVVP